MILRAPLRRFTVDEYHRLAAAGVLPDDETRVELIDGRVLDKHPLAPHKYTVDDYERMHDAGVLAEDDRVELIEGDVVEMAPIGSRHLAAVNRLTRALVTAVGDRGIVSVQNPIRLGERSMPQPDVAVLMPRGDQYQSAIPGSESVLLLIEVSDTTLEMDTETKLPLYAGAGVREVWIVNLIHESIEVFRQPLRGGYATHLTFARGDAAGLEALSDVTIRVEEIVGSPS